MIKETGRVVAIETDSVWVETIRQSTCNSCSVQKGCGHRLLNKAGAGKAHHLRVLLGGRSATDFQLDDEVDISIPEQVLVTGALLVYLLPLITLLAGAIFSALWWAGDIAAFIGAVAGFLAGLGVVKWHAVINRDNERLQPVIMSRRGAADTQVLPPIAPA